MAMKKADYEAQGAQLFKEGSPEPSWGDGASWQEKAITLGYRMARSEALDEAAETQVEEREMHEVIIKSGSTYGKMSTPKGLGGEIVEANLNPRTLGQLMHEYLDRHPPKRFEEITSVKPDHGKYAAASHIKALHNERRNAVGKRAARLLNKLVILYGKHFPTEGSGKLYGLN